MRSYALGEIMKRTDEQIHAWWSEHPIADGWACRTQCPPYLAYLKAIQDWINAALKAGLTADQFREQLKAILKRDQP
jgi:hypothetical protein